MLQHNEGMKCEYSLMDNYRADVYLSYVQVVLENFFFLNMCRYMQSVCWKGFLKTVFIFRDVLELFGCLQYRKNSLAGVSVKHTIKFSVLAFVETQKGRQ